MFLPIWEGKPNDDPKRNAFLEHTGEKCRQRGTFHIDHRTGEEKKSCLPAKIYQKENKYYS